MRNTISTREKDVRHLKYWGSIIYAFLFQSCKSR